MLDKISIRRKIILSTLTLSAFLFLTTVLVLVYYLSSQGKEVPWFLKIFIDYHIYFMIITNVMGVGSGLVLFYLSRISLEKQEEKTRTSTSLLMKFLAEDEREIIYLIKEKGGMTTQTEIANLPKMTRLKAHRVVKKLGQQGLVQIHKHGKINMIQLVEELKDI